MIDLSKNENTSNILDIKEIINNIDFNRYSFDKNYKLLDELANFYNLKSDNFILGNGSSNVIYMSLLALYKYSKSNIHLISPLPTFDLTLYYAKNIGYSIDGFYLDNEFNFDINKIKIIPNKINIIYLVNPNNPTGLMLSKKDLNELNSICKDNVYMLLDEAYCEFADDFYSLEFAKNPNILHIRTFSKMYSLAGLRVGYGIAHNKLITILKDFFSPDAINAFALECAIYALRQKDFIKTTKQIINTNKALLENEFETLNIKYFKSHTNFILHEIKNTNYADFMKECGIVVGRTINNYPLLNRISIGNQRETNEFIKALKLAKVNCLV